MLRLAVKNILAKKLRLLSTALAVTLGVAFLAGTLVFTDTIQRTFDDLFADVFDGTDTYVQSSNSIELDFGGEQRGRIPDDLVATVAGVDGVADAQGFVQGFAQVVDSDGQAIGNPGQGAPTFGMTYITGQLSSWVLTEGSRAPGPDELVLDKATADKGDFEIGDTVTVLTATGPHSFPLVGTARFGTVDSPGGASVSIFDLATAQQVLLGGPGQLDAVMAAAADGVDERDLTARVAAVLPEGVEALTGSEITEQTQDDIRQGLSFFNTFLIVFAVIGLIVACFTIYNTFQIIVTQRAREMALLRAIGASRRQVLQAQMLEAVVIGLVASVIGLVAGIGVASLLKGLLAAFGIDIPAGGIVFKPRTAIVALIVGTLVTVVSAVFPSVRASRVPPLAALRDVAFETASRPLRRLIVGGVITIVGIAVLTGGLLGGEIALVGLGAFFVLIGVFVLAPLIARPVVRVLGAPLRAISGVAGSLARQNAMRNPKRTARTGGALMVGVALIAAITIIAGTLKDWIADLYGEQFMGDVVVATDSFGFGGLSPDLADRLNELPEVDMATGIRVGAARIAQDGEDSDESYVSVDPATAAGVFDIGMVEGTVEALTPQGILLDDDEASTRGLAVGDTLQFTFLNGTTQDLTVEGIYTEQDLAGPFLVSHALHAQSGTDQFDISIYVRKADGVSAEAAKAAVATAAEPYANADVQTRQEYVDDQAAQVDQLVNLIYGLLGLAVVIALFSIANSMALSIYERTRELGLLRAVGMSRRQTKVSVRWESALIALLGTALGMIIGVFFGWSISVTIRDDGLTAFTMPIAALVVILVLAVLGGVVFSLRPARRASRLEILHAIATE